MPKEQKSITIDKDLVEYVEEIVEDGRTNFSAEIQKMILFYKKHNSDGNNK